MTNTSIYYLYFLLSQFMWGLLPAFWMLLRDLTPLYTLASRIVWAAVFCFLLIMQKHLLSNFKSLLQHKEQWPYVAGACILITVNWGSYIFAVTQGYILQASLAYFINPLVVIFFGGLIFHETVGKLQQLAIAIAATGLLIAFILYGAVPYLSFLICLSWASYSLLKKKITLDSQVSVFIESFSMVPLSLLFIFWSESTGLGAAGHLQGLQWLLLPLTGIVTAVPMMLFSAGVKGIPMTIAGILMYTSPSITLLVGLYSGETITEPMAITFMFAWIAIVLYSTGAFRSWKRFRHSS